MSRIIPPPTFPAPGPAYDARNESEFRRMVETAVTDLRAAIADKPNFQVTCIRSGTSATLTVTVDDPGRQVTELMFNKREGAASETGFVDTWDTSTGTIGSSTALVRVEAISVPAGLDSVVEWRAKWRDRLGEERTEGGPVAIPNQSSATKKLRIPATYFRQEDDTVTFSFSGGGGFLYPNVTATFCEYYAAVPLPVGVTITAFRARVYAEGNDVGETAEAFLAKISEAGSNTTVTTSTLSYSVAGWSTVEETGLSETVATDVYFAGATLRSIDFAVDTRLMWIEIEYVAPNHVATY